MLFYRNKITILFRSETHLKYKWTFIDGNVSVKPTFSHKKLSK